MDEESKELLREVRDSLHRLEQQSQRGMRRGKFFVWFSLVVVVVVLGWFVLSRIEPEAKSVPAPMPIKTPQP